MFACPKCGYKAKHGEFCEKCGTRLQQPAAKGASLAPAPSAIPSLLTFVLGLGLGGVILFLLIAGVLFIVVALVVLAIINITQSSAVVNIAAPNQTEVNANMTVVVTLTDLGNAPLANKNVTITNGERTRVVTDTDGKATVILAFNETGRHKLRAVFAGDKSHSNATGEVYVDVKLPSCGDGTSVGECATYVGFLCNATKEYEFRCDPCGCVSNKVCYDNYCWTPEEKSAYIISKLQKSMVFIANSYATGSGVIIAQDHNRSLTFILTNRHVVQDATSVQDLRITTNDRQTIPATAILVAPYDMDLALVILLGIHGEPATINTSEVYYKGSEVIAMGSPLGIQGSVSNGIVSNFVQYRTDTGYTYTTVQTDAAINPGNSGGGLFLKNNGHLIGINSFVLTSQYGAEGLGFAISVDSMNKLPNIEYWDQFTPTKKCSDDTPYGLCSKNTPGKFCSNGNLLDDCTKCGCGKNAACLNNKCFSCQAGYDIFQSNDGTGICCPHGWQLYEGGNQRFCCPPGTRGYVDGTCH